MSTGRASTAQWRHNLLGTRSAAASRSSLLVRGCTSTGGAVAMLQQPNGGTLLGTRSAPTSRSSRLVRGCTGTGGKLSGGEGHLPVSSHPPLAAVLCAAAPAATAAVAAAVLCLWAAPSFRSL
eukprot:358553-Chlamydomonas_euryale.AAC.2